jgi:hypothetical protein
MKLFVSSDEDSGEGSVDDPEENKDLMRLFRVEEGRDFSYLIDVITEAGFRGWDPRYELQYLALSRMPDKPFNFRDP